MKLNVNGYDIPVVDGIRITIVTDAAGEILPQVAIANLGGKLDCYRSKLTVSGNVAVHLFSTDLVEMNCPVRITRDV